MTISSEEGEFMLADWIAKLEQRGWTWAVCPVCGEGMMVAPQGQVEACGVCDPVLWLSKIARYYPSEGEKA